MALLDRVRFYLAKNEQLRERVAVAAARTAIQVASEPGATDNHAQRVNLGNRVLTQPENYIADISFAVAVVLDEAKITPNDGTNPELAAGCTDADISSAISSVWDALAVS
jgi:hypothetical protein